MKQAIDNFKKRYSHIIMPLALVGGFIVDIFTLNRIDQLFDNALLIFHLLISGTAIVLLFSRGTFFGKKYLSEQRISWLETIMVFSFGALFSGFIIFYTKSGSLIISWPFILAMIVLMLGSEFKKKYFYRLRLQIVIYTIAVTSWSIFFIPVISKKMGSDIFVISTLVSGVLIFGFFKILHSINKPRFTLHKKALLKRSFAVLLFFNLLYFTNILPPIPLSLKYQSVYYEIKQQAGLYHAQYEKTAWYNFFQKHSHSMYWREGEDIYFFTQVFAPTQLKTTIVHTWEYYRSDIRRWEQRDTIDIIINGGRKEGYRGFSKKTNLTHGTWRVKTQTENGQTLGIKNFKIIPHQTKTREIVWEEL